MSFLDSLVEAVVRGDRSVKNRQLKKKINALKRRRKCGGNMTPSVKVVNGVPKVTCTPKDKKKARLQKKLMRIRKSRVSQFKKSIAKAKDTKRFRNILKK